MNFQQTQCTILNVDTYRYEGNLDQLYNEKDEIWQHKRLYWEKDFEILSTDCIILQNEIVDDDSIRIYMSMMDFIEGKIAEEQAQIIQEPKFLHLLQDFKETQLFNQMLKTLKWFNDALRQRNLFKDLIGYKLDESTLTQMKNMVIWMKGEERMSTNEQKNLLIFNQLLNNLVDDENSLEDEINDKIRQKKSKNK